MSAFNDIVKQLSSRVHLREDERARMQHNIREYMAHTPVRSARATETPTSFIALVQYRFTAVLVAVAVLLTSGVGVVFASNDALPGDALYAIKEAKEEIQQQLIFDETEQTEFAIERAHRRLQEVELLAARGDLSEERETVATEKFTQLRDEVQTRIAKIEEEKPQEAAALTLAFTTGVDARVGTLASRSAKASEETNDARERVALALESSVQKSITQKAPEEATTLAVAVEPPAMALQTESERSDETRAQESEAQMEGVMALSADTRVQVLPVQDIGAPPVALATLMRTIAKQRSVLEEIREKHTKDEIKGIDDVLKKVTAAQKEITAAVQLRDHSRAQKIGEEALALLYKTIAAIDAQLDIEVNAEVRVIEQERSEPTEEEEGESTPPTSVPVDLPSIESFR